MRKLDAKKIKKILIICLNGLGDVINTTPLIQSIKRAFPRSTLYFLVKNKFMEAVCGKSSLINEYIHYDPREKSISYGYRLLRILIDKEIDLSLTTTDTDLQKGPLLVFLSGIPIRVGEVKKKYYSRGFGFLYNYPVEKNYSQHRVQSNLDLFRKISSERPVLDTYFNIDLNHEKEKINFLKEKFGSSKRDYICIHPGCNIEEYWRRWPIDNYVRIAQKISQLYQIHVIFLGGPDETNLIPVIKKIKNETIINGINRFSIGTTASIIKTSQLIIGNDSGPMHIAGAFKVPTVSLMASVDPKRCAPWRNKNFIIRPPGTAEGKFSIKQINVNQVLESVEKALKINEEINQ